MTTARIFIAHHFWPGRSWPSRLFEPVLIKRIALDQQIMLGPHPDLVHDGYADTHAQYAVWRRGVIWDYVGFMQYRRVFVFPPLGEEERGFGHHEARLCNIAEAEERSIVDWLDGLDIVVPRPDRFRVEAQFKACHIPIHWDIMREEWDGHFPADQTTLHPHNMFIMCAAEFEAYMAFWSALMKRLEARIAPPQDRYQSRAFAFLSERIFTLWLAQRRERLPHLKVAEIPVVVGAKIR